MKIRKSQIRNFEISDWTVLLIALVMTVAGAGLMAQSSQDAAVAGDEARAFVESLAARRLRSRSKDKGSGEGGRQPLRARHLFLLIVFIARPAILRQGRHA